MSRSNWKGPYINTASLNLKQSNDKTPPIYLTSRNSDILPKFVGLEFKVHNGKKYVTVSVLDTMVGYKFGEFVLTRAKFNFKKKSKK